MKTKPSRMLTSDSTPHSNGARERSKEFLFQHFLTMRQEGASELSDTQPMKQGDLTDWACLGKIPLDPSPREISESLWTRLAAYGRGILCGGSEPQPAKRLREPTTNETPKNREPEHASGSSPPLV